MYACSMSHVLITIEMLCHMTLSQGNESQSVSLLAVSHCGYITPSSCVHAVLLSSREVSVLQNSQKRHCLRSLSNTCHCVSSKWFMCHTLPQLTSCRLPSSWTLSPVQNHACHPIGAKHDTSRMQILPLTWPRISRTCAVMYWCHRNRG